MLLKPFELLRGGARPLMIGPMVAKMETSPNARKLQTV
jgi:hypothetical protein